MGWTIALRSLHFVSIQWTANATNDMLADAVLTVILQVDTSPISK